MSDDDVIVLRTGDRLLCVDASDFEGDLERGRVYELDGVSTEGYLYFKDHKGGWMPGRFEKVVE